jgi:hypothetical protein
MRAHIALAGVAVVVFAACGSGGGKKTTATTSGTTAPTSTIAAGAPTPITGPPTTAATVADVSLKTFKSPTGNIGCVLDASYARCDIRERTWTPPPKPANCDLDWGSGLAVSPADAGTIVCAGDTAYDPGAPVLSYGQRTRQSSMVCASAESGVTCTHEASGHGFFLSRDSYRLF